MDIKWADRIREMEGWGWTLTAIGEAVGKHVATISDLKQGRSKSLNGYAAVRLHQLYEAGNGPATPTQAEAA